MEHLNTWQISNNRPQILKNEHRVNNSPSFVKEVKTWQTNQDEIRAPYDVVHLYPPVPLDKAITVLTDILNMSIEEIKTRTKMTLTGILKLTELYK